MVLPGDVHAVDLNDDVSLLQSSLSCRRKFLYTTYQGRILITDVKINRYNLVSYNLEYQKIRFGKWGCFTYIPPFLTYQLYGIPSPCFFLDNRCQRMVFCFEARSRNLASYPFSHDKILDGLAPSFYFFSSNHPKLNYSHPVCVLLQRYLIMYVKR